MTCFFGYKSPDRLRMAKCLLSCTVFGILFLNFNELPTAKERFKNDAAQQMFGPSNFFYLPSEHERQRNTVKTRMKTKKTNILHRCYVYLSANKGCCKQSSNC